MSEKDLVNKINKHQWSPDKQSISIKKTIQHIKFGSEDYGYGPGTID